MARSAGVSSVPLRLLGALALAVSAYVHVDLAQGPRYAAGEVTLAGLFVAQAVAAVAVAVWVLVLPSRLAWAAVLTVALGSLLPLVVSTYVRLPGPGPLPVVYDPFWYAEKVVAAVAAGLAVTAAAVALVAGTRRSARAPRLT